MFLPSVIEGYMMQTQPTTARWKTNLGVLSMYISLIVFINFGHRPTKGPLPNKGTQAWRQKATESKGGHKAAG